MALEKFRAPAIPLPPNEYNRQQFDEIFRSLRLYFNQLDSLTPNQANSYRADNFFGGDLSVDDATATFLNALEAYVQAATIDTITNNYGKIQSLLNNRIISKDVMAANFYGGNFEGLGGTLILPHIAASDSTDQIAGGDDTPTVVNWNTLDSGFGWTLNSPGSATANVAGVYTIRYSLQFANTANAIHDATVWLQKNGSDVANSTTFFSIPARKSAGVPSYVCGYSEATFEVDVGDEIELYWATDLAGNPTTPTDGVYIFHDAAQVSPPYDRPAIPSAIGSIAFVSALNKTKVAPLSVYGYWELGSVTILTT
jgi:hypothetical protein